MTLKEHWKSTGLKQPAYAGRLGFEYRTLTNWMSGRSRPKLADALLIEARTGGQVAPCDWLTKSEVVKWATETDRFQWGNQ